MNKNNRLNRLISQYGSIYNALINNDIENATYMCMHMKYFPNENWENVIEHIIQKNISNIIHIFARTNEPHNIYLLDYIIKSNNIKLLSNIFTIDRLNDIAKTAAQYGKIDILNECLNYDNISVEIVADGAIIGGHIGIVVEMIKRGAKNHQNMFKTACIYGHLSIINKLFSIFGNKLYNDISTNTCIASAYGHLDIVLALLKTGYADINLTAIYAAKNGHLDIIIKLLDIGELDLNLISLEALKHNHVNITIYMINNGANNYDEIAYVAAQIGDLDLINQLRNVSVFDNNKIACIAIEYNHNHIFNDAVLHGINNMNDVAKIAAKKGNKKIVDIAVFSGANNYDDIAKEGISYKDIVLDMIDKGANKIFLKYI